MLTTNLCFDIQNDKDGALKSFTTLVREITHSARGINLKEFQDFDAIFSATSSDDKNLFARMVYSETGQDLLIAWKTKDTLHDGIYQLEIPQKEFTPLEVEAIAWQIEGWIKYKMTSSRSLF
jgi:hypothetical protein